MIRAALVVSLLVLHSHALISRSRFDFIEGGGGRYIDFDALAPAGAGEGAGDLDEENKYPKIDTDDKVISDMRDEFEDISREVVDEPERDQESELDSGHEDNVTALAKINFSPERRKEMHDYKYEADFWVELNMTKAHEGTPMGVVVFADEDWIPMTVTTIKKWGLVADWNTAHPDLELHVGDQIVQVNNIVWHANSRTFENHVVGQFKAGRRALPGASATFKFHVLRLRKDPAAHRTAYQRYDAHRKLYPKEFVAELPVHRVKPGTSMEHVLGMTLNYWPGHNYMEPWVQDIQHEGIVATWNSEHPDRQIMEGDEIIKVNHRNFLRNRSEFQAHFREQYDRAHRLQLPFDLYVRRPIYVQDLYDRLPSRELVVEHDRYVDATLPLSARGDERLALGWQVEEVDSDESPLKISKIRGQGSVANWNAANPNATIMPGDVIVKVNGAHWRNNSLKFSANFAKQLQASRGKELRLLVKRRESNIQPLNRLVNGTRNKVSLQADTSLLDTSLGMNVSADDRFSPVYVAGIEERGLVAQWNAANPGSKIEVNDFIVSVNGVPWRRDSDQYTKFIQRQFRASMTDALQEGRLDIVLQKPFGDVGHEKKSLEGNVVPAEGSDVNNATDEAGDKDEGGWVGAED